MRSASDSLASSDSSSPFASGAASFEFPTSDNIEELFQCESDTCRRGCYRFGVWKNVKVCQRHLAPCLTLSTSAAGKWGHRAAAQPCNVQKCSVRCARVVGGCANEARCACACSCNGRPLTFPPSSPLQPVWKTGKLWECVGLNAFLSLFRYFAQHLEPKLLASRN